MATPAKGKAKVKVTSSGRKVSFGQAGKFDTRHGHSLRRHRGSSPQGLA